MSRQPWRELARCLGLGNLWDATIDDDQSESVADRKARHKAAAAICADCTVRNQCFADATISRDEGMRSGILLPSLSGKFTGRKESQATHGTAAAARAHYRRGEKMCDRCRAAESDRRKKRAS